MASLVVLGGFLGPSPAQAVVDEGHSNRSFYVRGVQSPLVALEQQACPIRNKTDSYRSQTSYVILQFGSAKTLVTPNPGASVFEGSTGYKTVGVKFQSYLDSAVHVIYFAAGWLACLETADREQKLEIIMGVSNSTHEESYANGQEFARVVQLLNDIFEDNETPIHVSGGFDSEVGYDYYSRSVSIMEGFKGLDP